MNPSSLTFWGLAVGLVVCLLYIGTALCRKKKPELSQAANLVFSAIGAVGAVRLIGFVFTGNFSAMVKMAATAASVDLMWNISDEDAAFLVIGGIALAWVSIQAIWQAFAEVW